MWRPQHLARAVLARCGMAAIAPLVAGLAMASAAPALAAEPPAKPAETVKPTDGSAELSEVNVTPGKPETDKAKKVCTTEQVTGSRLSKRVCRTQDMTVTERKKAQDIVNQRYGATSPVRLDYVPMGKK